MAHPVHTVKNWQWRKLITSFAITLYGQCCRLLVVCQQVVSDIIVVRSWIICILCSESNNLYYTGRLLFIDVLHLKRIFSSNSKHSLTYSIAACTWWPWIQNLVTSLHLIYYTAPKIPLHGLLNFRHSPTPPTATDCRHTASDYMTQSCIIDKQQSNVGDQCVQ